MRLLALGAKLESKAAPMDGPTSFSTTFKSTKCSPFLIADIVPLEEMESFLLDSKDITFNKDSSGQRIILGEGAFGIVFRGMLISHTLYNF